MTSKLRQMSVNASVRLSMWCQHFQNPKAPRPLGRCRWNLARIFYGPGRGAQLLWSRILNFSPCATQDNPELSLVGRDNLPQAGCL